MASYYARRAAEYELIYTRPGRQAELRTLEAALTAAFSDCRVLEVACGTGWWTTHGARDAKSWLATDLNPGTLAIARQKSLPACVTLAQADAFDLPVGDFNAAFGGFWWSHVPLQQLSAWLASLHALLQPGAKVVFVDNLYVERSSTPISRTDDFGNTYQVRLLGDGSQHEVLKNFLRTDDAIALLGPRAVQPRWLTQQHYWMLSYGLS